MNRNVKESCQYDYLLVSYSICPYVQRVAFFLEEAGIDYDVKYINPYKEKPDWFVDISPTGKVPLLAISPSSNKSQKPSTLYESSIILEYLNDVSNNEYLPIDPIERANHRLWIRDVEKLQTHLGEIFSSASETAFKEDLEKMKQSVSKLENYLINIQGEEQNRPSLLSYSYAPVFFVLRLIELISHAETLPQQPAIREFAKAVTLRPAFKKTINSQYYQELIEFFIAKKSFLSECTESFMKTSDWKDKLQGLKL